MLQSRRWCEALDAAGLQWRERTVGVFSTPMLEKTETGAWRRPAV